MNHASHSLLAAAVSGILVGCGGAQASSAEPKAEAPSTATREAKDTDKHACKGQNDCAHQGGCKTEAHACKGQNDCRAQGGCHG